MPRGSASRDDLSSGEFSKSRRRDPGARTRSDNRAQGVHNAASRGPAASDSDDGGTDSGSVLSLIVMLIIVAIAVLQLAQVGVLYVQNRTELDAAKAQEAQLAAQKAELEDQIQRWDDKTYVEAQARSRLGFVYSGEKPVYLINTGRDSDSEGSSSGTSQNASSTMPWYKELMYSLQKSDDESDGGSTDATIGKVLGTQASGDASGAASGSSSATASGDGTAEPGADPVNSGASD